ncbi:efflux RND transporter periplasmic adaptor subunit [Tenacibaculum sp. nBUS_03]|uniref:efflux RND transporter periplasmic adaptor subunit n=1 Tax=Tenacibaculum sp. nBUS_03 TaxID=3395320 RepID=UPI003EBD1E96
MKKYIVPLLFIIIVSCNSKKEDHSGHDHSKDKHKKQSFISKEEKHEENKLHLTKEQIQNVDLTIERLSKKMIRSKIAVTGTIEAPPQNKATIYAPMEAFVFSTDVLPGDKILKGQTVAILEHPNFIKLQYSYLEAINNCNVAKADYERKKMLLEKDITSKKSFQASEGKYKSLQSLVSSYASQLKMAGLSPTDIRTSGIQQYVYVKSPITGFVVENNINKGKFLMANSEMIEVIDNEHIHAELNVFGSDIARIKKGSDFIFKPSGLDIEYKGYIKLISQKVDDKTKTVNVHGHFEDPEGRLKSGMYINAEVLLEGNEVYAIPERAVIEKEGENFIFITKNESDYIATKVTIGNSDKGFLEIKEIENNNFNVSLVTSGAHFLKGKLMQMSGNMDGHAH